MYLVTRDKVRCSNLIRIMVRDIHKREEEVRSVIRIKPETIENV